MMKPMLQRHLTRNKRSQPARKRKNSKTDHRHPFQYHPTYDQHKSCRIQQLYVSFKDLQWHVRIFLCLFVVVFIRAKPG